MKIALSLATACALVVSVRSLPAWAAEPLSCPVSASASDVSAWRDLAVQTHLVGDRNTEVLDALNRCFADGKPACLSELTRNVTPVDPALPGPDESGFDSLDSLPDASLMPAEFQVKTLDGSYKPGVVRIPANLFELAQDRGWIVSTYKTRSTGGFEHAPGLLIIAVPGPTTDVYLQISVPEDTNATLTNNDPIPHPTFALPLTEEQFSSEGAGSQLPTVLTVVSVDKTRHPAVGRLRMMFRTNQTPEYAWTSAFRNVHSCQGCHGSPLRAISPRGYRVTNGDEKRMLPDDERSVDGINRMMNSYGYVSWGELEKNGRRLIAGPDEPEQPLGWAPLNSPTRQQAFIDLCKSARNSMSTSGFGNYSASFTMGDPAAIRWEKVAGAMNCVGCHNGTYRGVLHTGFGSGEVMFKVMTDRSMPPGRDDLTLDERMALYSCLYAERDQVRDQWRSRGEWLKKVQCTGTPAPSN